jgi:hypothetical protein
MQCQQVHEHLSAYVDRELTSELSAAVRAHLDACAECRALADDLRATADLLGRLPVQAAPKHLAEDIQREIERRTILPKGGAEQQPQERSLPIARVRMGPRALAVAAAVVLAAGIGLFTYLGHTRPAAPDKRVAMQTRPPPAPVLRPEGEGPGARPAKEAAPAATADHAAKMEVAKAPAPVMAPSVPFVGGGAALRDRGGSSIEAEKKYEVARAPAATPRPAEKPAPGEPMRDAVGKAAGNAYDNALAMDAAQKRSGQAAAPAVAEGPDAVQLTMNQVANGEARVDQLQAVATSRNLRRADNQLVVRSRTVDEANLGLLRLFEANGWRPVTLAADEGYYRATGAPMKPFGKDAGKRQADVQAAPGIYYLASRGAETTWVVVTDRDNLSRFGGQLAQASGITISAGSSGDLARAVGQLQSELREQDVAQKSRPVETDTRAKAARRGQTEVAAKPAAPSQSPTRFAFAPSAAAPAEAAPPAAAAPVASKTGPRPAAAAGPYAEQAAPASAGQRTAGVESAKPAAHEKAQAAEREESPPTAQQAGRANDTQVLLVIRVLAGMREADAKAAEASPAEPAAPPAAAKEAAH